MSKEVAKKKPDKQEFSTPAKVWRVTEDCQAIEIRRSEDRTRVETLFNGRRPYAAEEQEKFQIAINVNWGDGLRIMQDANRQINNATIHPGLLFTCKLEHGDVNHRDEWSQIFTELVQKPIQRGRSSKRYRFTMRSRNASVCMHGIGALLWPNSYRWLPRFIPLEDLLIPTDTVCDFSNIKYFAVNLYLSPGEFADMTQGDKVDKGWNQEQCRKILDGIAEVQSDSTPSTWMTQPSEMANVFKQNRGFYYSDAIPKVKLRAFYFQENEAPNKWYRHIILRENVGNANTDTFVYDGADVVFADTIDHILNVQYGDSNLVPPLRYHAARGLGTALYSPVDTLNRLRCEFIQHIFENLKMYFRIQDPADRDRLKQVVLQAYGYLPEGLQIVPREQRHQIDSQLVIAGMQQMRQNMDENASSYVSQLDDGSSKERTKYEVSVLANQANQLISGTLAAFYMEENSYYEEHVRRFCKKDSADPQVITFRKNCIERGIPEDLLVADKWKVTVERVFGGGDTTLAQAQAQWLLTNINMYPPESQIKIKRAVTSTMLQDPEKANDLVPPEPVLATNGTYVAEQVFGTLMQGVQVTPRQNTDVQGYITSMLKMMAGVIQRIQQTDNVGTPEQLVGLVSCAQNVGIYVMQFSADERNKQEAKQFADVLGNLMNELKGFAARQAQAQEQQQPDPEAQAKAQTQVMLAENKAKINMANAQLKQRQKQIDFELQQQRDNMKLWSELKREDLRAEQERWNSKLTAIGDTVRQLKQQKIVDSSSN